MQVGILCCHALFNQHVRLREASDQSGRQTIALNSTWSSRGIIIGARRGSPCIPRRHAVLGPDERVINTQCITATCASARHRHQEPKGLSKHTRRRLEIWPSCRSKPVVHIKWLRKVHKTPCLPQTGQMQLLYPLKMTVFKSQIRQTL